MSKKLHLSFVLAIIFSMVLSACASPTPAPVIEPAAPAVVEPTKVPAPTKVVEPTAVPTPEPEPVVEVDIAAMAAGMFAAMPADKSFASVSAAKLNEELAEKAPFLVDLREASEIEKDGYIEGAINIPTRSLLKNLDKLPGLDAPIVLYCGIGHRGGFALSALTALGYTKVRSLSGGIALWKAAELPLVTGAMPEAKSISSPIVADQALFTLWDDFLTTLPEGFLVVKADKVAELLAENDPPFVLDLRTDAEVEKDGYIEGSVHIPMHSLLDNLDKLPATGVPMVLYCGIGHRGAIVLPVLKMLGYENVTSLYGGLRFWKSAGMTVAGWVDWNVSWSEYFASMPANFYGIKADGLNTALVENPPFLVDLRETAEIEKTGYIEGAIHIPTRELLNNLDMLPAKDAPIVVYCASGHRGGFAMAALQMLGYTNVKSFVGGAGAWKKAELPFVEGLPPAGEAGDAPEVDPVVLRDLQVYFAALPDNFYVVTSPDLNTEIADGTDLFIVDNRTDEEWANGYLENAVHIPIHDLFSRKAELPADKNAPIVLVCQSGHRGAIGLIALRMTGYTNVRNLGGGMNAWAAAELPVVK